MIARSALVVSLLLAGAGDTHAASPERSLHSIAIVDIMPTHANAGARLLAAYAAALRRAAGVTSVALIQQAGSDNHFIIDTRFDSDAAYRRVVESTTVLAFRNEVQPHLGGPWDERLGHDVAE